MQTYKVIEKDLHKPITRRRLLQWFVRLNLRHFEGSLAMPDIRIGECMANGQRTDGYCCFEVGDDHICIDKGLLDHPKHLPGKDCLDMFQLFFHEILHWHFKGTRNEASIRLLQHHAHWHGDWYIPLVRCIRERE